MPLLTALLAMAAVQAPVEVPFRATPDAIIVDTVINGHNISCMFDTGFGGCAALDNTINLGEPTGHINLRDFVGVIEEPTINVKSLKLGSKSVDPTGMEVVLAPPEDYSFVYGTHCDGIMGLQVIKNNITEINFQNHKFIFYPNSYDISAKKPDNKTTFLLKMLPLGNNSVMLPVTTPGNQVLTMGLDTGNSFYATTHRDSLQRVGLWDSSREPKYTSFAGVASGQVVSWDKKMTNMSIFGVPVAASTWDIIDLPSSSADSDGTVGYQFLKNFNITIDYARRRVWLENWTGKVENDPPGELGLAAVYSNEAKKVIIFNVSPDSPGDVAGIKKGDEVLSIGDIDIAGIISFQKLQKMLAGPVGSKLKLTLSHQGNLKRYELERKPLVND